ncbi:Winged helix-like DNA-binding domain superfamily [Sesbania bispinosa]|nr:Winged helix-like DNA-binding domain superfamily [Sesbania bispinosa]
MENQQLVESKEASSQDVEKLQVDASAIQNEDQDKQSKEAKAQNIGHDGPGFDNELDDVSDVKSKSNNHEGVSDNVIGESELAQRKDESRDLQSGTQQENIGTKSETEVNTVGQEYSGDKVDASGDFEHKSEETNPDNNSGQHDLAKEKDDSGDMESTHMYEKTDEIPNEDHILEPVFDGTEIPGMEANRSTSTRKSDADQDSPGVVEKAVALKNFVKEKSAVAVSTMLRRLSGKRDEGAVGNSDDEGKDVSDISKVGETKVDSEKPVEKFGWNPLNYIKKSSDVDVESKTEQRDSIKEGLPPPIAMKGRIILYTKLGCQESKEIRLFLRMKRLGYVEINIDVYPSRKMELEKVSGSTSVPKVYFNEILIGGLSALKTLDESGKLDEKIDFLITEAPLFETPSPPLSGEDDVSSSGVLDEMALIVRKMKESVAVKDRLYKMRRFTNCFLGSEAVDFLSEDQYLERQEAVDFARKLASKLFFRHVLDEDLFEDGNHLYRFLDDDPIVVSQCHNIPRGIITTKPKPIAEIASRLWFLSLAMFEAYVSEDGRHVDYTSMHGSEEFARYLRIVEELQRVEIWDLSREEKLAFFINLYNMMAIHAILVLGHPDGPLERRKLFGEFKYVIGGSTYSLSAIQNGILRGNQRPPYNIKKPFGAKDKRSKVALPYPEPLIHFALVYGTRSGPALRCYSPRNIDEELLDAARNFLRSGGVVIDLAAKSAYASKILKWYSIDFGKSEVEVIKHVSNYLDPADSEILLDLLATSELKVTYQPYDWGLNC